MTQEAMALAVGISEAAYQKHEQGTVHMRNDFVITYCKLVKVRFDQIRNVDDGGDEMKCNGW